MNGACKFTVSAFSLLIPFCIIRFLLPFILNKKAIQRAAHFAPVQGRERTAYYIYQLSNAGLLLYLFFLKIQPEHTWWFYTGLVCYFSGLCLCSASMIAFAFPDNKGLNTNGIYRFSRNPMYVGYFICFTGMSILTCSLILFCIILVFQISAHWIILAEERECIQRFGEDYIRYMKQVRRYV